jgi:hypothetical protein
MDMMRHFSIFFCGAGEDWFYQSTIIVRNPKVTMPRFQLKTSNWSQVLSRQTCGDALNIPGREGDMGSLRLSADDLQWARQTFSRAASQFFQKLRNGKWTIEGLQYSPVIYRWGQQIPPRKLQKYIRQAAELSTEMYSLCS